MRKTRTTHVVQRLVYKDIFCKKKKIIKKLQNKRQNIPAFSLSIQCIVQEQKVYLTCASWSIWCCLHDVVMLYGKAFKVCL